MVGTEDRSISIRWDRLFSKGNSSLKSMINDAAEAEEMSAAMDIDPASLWECLCELERVMMKTLNCFSEVVAAVVECD